MKKTLSVILSFLAVAGFVLSSVSCVEQIPPVIEDLTLGRPLSPTNFTAKVVNGEYIEFDWDNTRGATSFLIEVCGDEAMTEAAYTCEVSPEEIPYTVHVEADMVYYARIKTRVVASEGGEPSDSKWTSIAESIKTYAIKDPVNPVAAERTATTITVTWTYPEGEPQPAELDRIVITPDGGEAVTAQLTAEQAAAASYSFESLTPSTKYGVSLWFKSANRGEVNAWTLPDVSGATEVSTQEALVQAFADGASKILVKYSDSPYVLEDVTLTGPVTLIGEMSAEGERPVIQCAFTVSDNAGGVIRFENLDFDGASYAKTHLITVKSTGVALSAVEVIGCNIYGMQRGVYYDNTGGSVESIRFDNCQIYDIAGSGGDCFDIRKGTSVIGSFKLTNCTFKDAARTLFRIDKSVQLASFVVTNCTFVNINVAGASNNRGIFSNYAAACTDYQLRKNVFLNMGADAKFMNAKADEQMPVVSDNFFYNIQPAFWPVDANTGTVYYTEAQATADGGAVLTEDPCVSSAKDIFNVTDETVASAGAGDARWLESYVPVIEDLTLTAVVPVKTWNLVDSKTFKVGADKDMVRDQIRFFVTQKAVNFTEEGFEFTAAATMGADGVPADGAIGFMVNGPGSVVLSTKAEDPMAVMTVSLDGVPAGAVIAGSENAQVVFADLNAGEEHMLYLIPSAPQTLTALQWSDDIESGGSVVLDTPVVSISKTSVNEGEAAEVTLSWEAVSKAGSYDVTIGENTYSTETNSYTFDASTLAAGTYRISVVAKPASTDLVRQPSEPSEEVVFTVNEVLKAIVAETAWGSAEFEYLFHEKSQDSKDTEVKGDFVYKNLGFINGSGKCKFGTGTNAAGESAYRYQFGGTGNSGKNALGILVGGSGTLVIEAASSSSSADRFLEVMAGETVAMTDIPAPKDGAKVTEVPVSAAAGSMVTLYSKGSGINVFSLKWIPAPSEGIPSDPEAIEADFMADYSDATKFPDNSGATAEEFTVDKVTYGKKIVVNSNSKRIKFGGSAEVGADGIPVNRFASFKITTPGTLTHKVISGSSSDAEREYVVILVKTVGGQQEVLELFREFSPTSSSAEARTLEITSEHLAGATSAVRLYVFPCANCNLYGLGFSPKK